mmetsp:Transcript_19527/g.31988  ORF Transcript_19527/g.31988 Transcript_19527/m.31988 type:complete len:873 (-) Transcript_19527:419-3037(-)
MHGRLCFRCVLFIAFAAIGVLGSIQISAVGTNGGRLFISGDSLPYSIFSTSQIKVLVDGSECAYPAINTFLREISCTVASGVGHDHSVSVRVGHSGELLSLGKFQYSAPRVEWVTSTPASGGPITVYGKNFGPKGTEVTVSVGGTPCNSAHVSHAHHQIACETSPGSGVNLDVVVVVSGQSSGDTGRGKFLYTVPWAVITTINPPTEDVRMVASRPGWNVVVVADRKTPIDWHVPNVHLLSIEEQMACKYAIKNHLGWNSYMRKNLGYLYAIEHGATIIYETDDDNKLLQDFIPYIDTASSVHWLDTCDSKLKVVNPYAYFGQPSVWPRGYPLRNIGTQATFCVRQGSPGQIAAPIQQYLADSDPDVDAIFRLTNSAQIGHITFNPSSPVIAVRRGIMAPYNTQNTISLYRAFWGLLMPAKVNWRVSDIWRSYITQRLLWDIGDNLAFGTSTVIQKRNPHDYMQDFQDEIQLYVEAGKFVDFLLSWTPSAEKDLPSRMVDLVIAAASHGFWEEADVNLTKAWISDLTALGYSFPKTDVRIPKAERCGVSDPYISIVVAFTEDILRDISAAQAFVSMTGTWAQRFQVDAELLLILYPSQTSTSETSYSPEAQAHRLLRQLLLPPLESIPVRILSLSAVSHSAQARAFAVDYTRGQFVIQAEHTWVFSQELGRLLSRKELSNKTVYHLDMFSVRAYTEPQCEANATSFLDEDLGSVQDNPAGAYDVAMQACWQRGSISRAVSQVAAVGGAGARARDHQQQDKPSSVWILVQSTLAAEVRTGLHADTGTAAGSGSAAVHMHPKRQAMTIEEIESNEEQDSKPNVVWLGPPMVVCTLGEVPATGLSDEVRVAKPEDRVAEAFDKTSQGLYLLDIEC